MAKLNSSTDDQVLNIGHSNHDNGNTNDIVDIIASSKTPLEARQLHKFLRIIKDRARDLTSVSVSLASLFVFMLVMVLASLSLPASYTLSLSFITNYVHPHPEENVFKITNDARSLVLEDTMALKEVLQAAAYVENDQEHIENHYNKDHDKFATSKKTLIITTINAAWAEKYMIGANATNNRNMVEMFIESMREGLGTRRLMRHVVIVCMDQRSYDRCMSLKSSSSSNNKKSNDDEYHKDDRFRCVKISTPGVDFSVEQLLLTADYIKMMWRRIKFLSFVLELGYDFIFTDADILWFRDPFPLLLRDKEADFQIACDNYNGKPFDLSNRPNAGFTYARANKRTVEFYNYWYEQRKRDEKMADQEVLNAIKFEDKFKRIGLKVRFLDTQLFGGFCAIKSSDMAKVITMHANCCKGLDAKIMDLHVILDDWKRWKRHNNNTISTTTYSDPHFQLPWACPRSWHKH